jgi:hypothetical protein
MQKNMELVLHAGAHFTEEERLMKCLLRNKDLFQQRGIAVPGPGKYRNLLRETMVAMENTPLASDAREVMLDAILDDASATRLILSNASFFATQRGVVRRGQLYPHAAERMAYMAQIFREDEIELFMALRNPASFLPAAFQQSPRERMVDFLGSVDPRGVRWSDMILRIREAAPEVAIVLWCNEDAPFIWTEILQEIAGLAPADPVVSGHDLLGDILKPDGMKRFESYMAGKPGLTVNQRRRVIEVFLEKFAREEAIEEELNVPDWTQELVAEMTETYDEDIAAIAQIPGVQLIAP